MSQRQKVLSSLLDLEAADYFKLDPAQVQLMQVSPQRSSKGKRCDAFRRHDCQVVEISKPRSGATDKRKGAHTTSCKAHLDSNEIDSAGSSNSLPSISSSPSVSPSLVCPHLSLDDILERRGGSKSPHTIGLCAKCRLNPPPHIQSPLSPALMANRIGPRPILRRGYSDYQARAKPKLAPGQRKQFAGSSGCLRDDSLDYCLDPTELRRMQLSPSQRNSVGFIRNNSTESGRVLRIYKNGQPFDRSIRVCITRSQFSHLSNLLDHINSRQLIPSGARYLFHLDGQLVYSINELKHNSIYIVSGTRTFNTRANSIIKEREQARKAKDELRSLNVGSERTRVNSLVVEKKLSPVKVPKKRAATNSTVDTKPIRPNPQKVLKTQSRSIENLAEHREEKTTKVTRTKSELSAVAGKRKKNVTFSDTGRGSSPAIVESKQNQSVDAEQADRNPIGGTNEIGIQVSDSIDGFLIDLPLPLPMRPQTQAPIKGGKSTGGPIGRSGGARVTSGSRSKPTQAKAKRQIVTITERQLSLDEMSKLKDLDQGDHHNEAHKISSVTIKLDSVDSEVNADQVTEEKGEPEPTSSYLDQDATIVIGQAPPETGSNKDEVTKGARGSKDKTLDSQDLPWQYPGGRKRIATPTERPVSQNQPSDTVCARVSTPSPSLSTMGDSASVTISLENEVGDQESKQQPPVMGRPVEGADMPAANFRLAWVNGFNINDQFPDNSTLTFADEPPKDNTSAHLSPSHASRSRTGSLSSGNQFKPSERFHNWVVYSQFYDELIFPAGSIMVLWARKTNTQRYYSKHTASIGALALATLDNKLAASAQQASGELDKSGPCIHLWALDSLETLRILDDDQFRGRTIFSLRLKNTSAEGCELVVAAKAEKRLWLYQGNNLLNQASPRKTSNLLRANKMLQLTQTPLLITRLSSTTNEQLLLTFGRRHFQVWVPDRRQLRLVPLQSESRSGQFVEAIVRATCLIKLTPIEFLIGDGRGRIALLQVKTNLNSKVSRSPSDKYALDWTLLDDCSADSPITCLARVSGNMFVSADSKYYLRFWRLHRSSTPSNETKETSNRRISCSLAASVSLPTDLGYVCTLLSASYSRRQNQLEFYVVSTSNAILFGSVQLQADAPSSSSSLSVVYEGHETSAINVVPVGTGAEQNDQYFTCSFDCKICKWDKNRLLWKSVLPSACAALSVHPIGFVLAVGSADGTVYILDKVSGLLVSYFPLTPVCINCLAYSRDGTLLAAGCANGSIFILPVYERGLKYKKVSIFQVSLHDFEQNPI